MRPQIRQLTYLALLSLAATLAPRIARACLRETLDDRAVQWSTIIVEAKLDEIGERQNPPATAPLAPRLSDPFQIFTFTVTGVLDGDAKAGQTVHVVRLLADHPVESRCNATLRGRKVGDRFILLLRRMESKVASKKSDQWVIVYLLNRDETDAGAMDDLHALIKDTRANESAGTDDAIAAQVITLAVAQDEVEADEAEKALLRFGLKALPALNGKMKDTSVNDAGKTRLKRVIDELTPPQPTPQNGD